MSIASLLDETVRVVPGPVLFSEISTSNALALQERCDEGTDN
jgi:hypothetical protein